MLKIKLTPEKPHVCTLCGLPSPYQSYWFDPGHNCAEAKVELLQQEIEIWREAFKASEAVRWFMTLPPDYWNDTWPAEREEKYLKAIARLNDMLYRVSDEIYVEESSGPYDPE